MKLTMVQQVLLGYVIENGPVCGFFQAVCDLGVNYSHAHNCLNRLEQEGLITVERYGPGKRIVIRASPGRGGAHPHP